MYLVLVPLLAALALALVWFWLGQREQREPASSVAQFNRALTALAPRDRDRS